ncbi:MAG: HD domain-containing protein [Candidatus Dehalobacter alkaniphilus]
MVLKEYEPLIVNVIKQLCEDSHFSQTTKYKQHGNISIYEHSIAVAYTSCWIASKLYFNVDYTTLIRGALLHDYFLYDWHERNNEHRLHAFSHPRKAMQNACEDFKLTSKEENIILRHMFPLTPIPPYYLESWIVCVADKYCALKETLRIDDIQVKKCIGAYQYDFK